MPPVTEGAGEVESEGLFGSERCFAQLWCRGRESNPYGVARVGNLSHDYTDRPELTEAIVWPNQWHGGG